jgi:predicted MFS family arabinose efflux permease
MAGNLNSSMIYLGIAIGAVAWTAVPPRFMTWVGLIFVLSALGCSMWAERAARREPLR